MIVTLHVTGACNLRCDYCYASPKTPAAMSLQTAIAAVNLAAERASEVHVIFFGGEPLLQRELLERVVKHFEPGRCGSSRLHYQLVTNGTLVDSQLIGWAAKNLVSISVSLDGNQKAHDSHRRTAAGLGSWQSVVERIPMLVQHNPYLHVQMMVSPDTARLLDPSLAFVFGLGVRFVSTAIDHSANWDRASLDQLQRGYHRAAAFYEKKTAAGDRFFLSCFDARIRTHVRGRCTEQERCSAGMHQMSVGPSGTIYPCVQFVGDDQGGEHVLGHVTSGFDEPARDRFHLASEADKQECRGCALQGRCTCWCACVNWSTTRSLARVSPVLCEHERMLTPIADQLASRLFRKRNALFIHKHYNAAFPIVSVAEDILEATAR